MASDKGVETPSGVIQGFDESDYTEFNSPNGTVKEERPADDEEGFKEGGYGW